MNPYTIIFPKKKRKGLGLFGKSMKDSILSILIGGLLLFLYAQYSQIEQNPLKDQFTYLEQTGQLLYYDGKVTELEKAQVTKITDGDTIRVLINEEEYIVRYIGINTPEIAHSSTETDEFMGREATNMNSWLVKDKTVYLKKDVTEVDKYNRLLRYVYNEDGSMVNYTLIRLGYAELMTIQPNVLQQQNFIFAQEKAREDGFNLWQFE